MLKNIKKIVIVGGGSAGWMSAAMLIKFFPDWDISVVESPDISTVGVGESTLLGIKNYCGFLEIDEKDFMTYTDASYKMSIKFTDFYEIGDGGFHYPFGSPEFKDTLYGIEDWFFKKALYPDTPNSDFARTYFPNAALYEQNKFSLNKHKIYGDFDPKYHVAYHFDAAKFGSWLKEKYCTPRGVTTISATVVDIPTSDKGVEKLILNTGEEVTADLFIDCTGWRSLLLGGALEEDFISYNDMLPNNRAWATQMPYKNKEVELEPFTNSTALGNGWSWNIPSWSRIGTGYVYSDKFISPDDAKEEFKQYLMSDRMIFPRTREEVDALVFKDIPMRVGIHKRTFVKNVVAIGLSAGFIEPLESNGLFSVHSFLEKLVKVLLSGNINQFDRDVYDTAIKGMFQNFAEFVALHYAFSKRDDTPYWQANNNRVYDKTMPDLTPTASIGFFDYQNQKMFKSQINPSAGMIWIATGMNHHVVDELNMRSVAFVQNLDLKSHFAEAFTKSEIKKQRWWNAAKNELSLVEYLEKYIHKGE
jgi:tryptophan halogenase